MCLHDDLYIIIIIIYLLTAIGLSPDGSTVYPEPPIILGRSKKILVWLESLFYYQFFLSLSTSIVWIDIVSPVRSPL
jgi:hypothetical protein